MYSYISENWYTQELKKKIFNSSYCFFLTFHNHLLPSSGRVFNCFACHYALTNKEGPISWSLTGHWCATAQGLDITGLRHRQQQKRPGLELQGDFVTTVFWFSVRLLWLADCSEFLFGVVNLSSNSCWCQLTSVAANQLASAFCMYPNGRRTTGLYNLSEKQKNNLLSSNRITLVFCSCSVDTNAAERYDRTHTVFTEKDVN